MTTYNIFPNGSSIGIGYYLNNGDIQNDYNETVGTRINSGGTENVYILSIGTVINSGGSQEVHTGGEALQTVIDGPGSGTLSRFYAQTIDQGGTSFSATINNNGTQGVYGTAAYTTINAGEQDVFVSGTANTTTINNGGAQYVGGTASGTTINNGGTQKVDGTASGTTINTGGTQYVANDFGPGSATDTTINGGSQKVYGLASGTTINAGGSQSIYTGGSVTGTTANAHGWQYLYGGTASGTVLNDAGQFIFSGSASNTTVNAQATQSVESGGTATNTTINAGGQEIVYAGGTTTNTTINGGLLDLRGLGSFAEGAITFAGTGGTLELDIGVGNSVAFAKPLNGFVVGDHLDMAGLAYGSTPPTVTRSGSTLTVTSEGASESVTLSGASASNFSLSKDSTGGVMVSGVAAVTPTIDNGGAISGSASIATPFSEVSIADGNTSATDWLTIAMSGTGGTLSGAGLVSGANGSYQLTGTPATVTSELDALTFHPNSGAANSISTTTFSLTAKSSAGPSSGTDALTFTSGNGDNLSIAATAGHDVITGNGNGDTFVFNSNFGTASVTDFYAHLGSAAGHDTVSLATSEFANFAAVLHDASQNGTSVLVTANNGDHLTLANMTLDTLAAHQSNFKFHA